MERQTSHHRTSDPPTRPAQPRARLVALLGPLTAVGRARLGDPPAVPGHAPAPARAGLLVARRRAAAARRDRGRGVLRVVVARPLLADLEAAAMRASTLRPSTGCSRPGSCSSACSCSPRRSSGDEVWRRGRGAATSGPGSRSGSACCMWPVMTFYTNSAIHMLAHSAWAQALMLLGAAELGLARGKLHSRWWRLPRRSRSRSPASRSSSTSRTRGSSRASAFLHHLLGWTLVLAAPRPARAGLAAALDGAPVGLRRRR